MKDVFLFSGLGADASVFEFLDLKSFRKTNIEWVDPEPGEAIADYTRRLLPQIKAERPILIGVSFGGILAIEVGKHIETEKIILISSVNCKDEIPRAYRVFGFFRINKIIPPSMLCKPNYMLFWLFGVETDQERQLLSDIIRRSDPLFIQWGISSIVTWNNESKPTNVIHIHGTNDRIFPCKKADYRIKDGGHFMIVNRSNAISEIITSLLK